MRKTAAFLLLLSGLPVGADAQDTHGQKVRMARRLIAAEPFASEMGGYLSQYERLSNQQLQQEIIVLENQVSPLMESAMRAADSYQRYTSTLIRDGKTTAGDIHNYADPTGQLQKLLAERSATYGKLSSANIRFWDLQTEQKVRANPDFYLSVERRLQADIAASKDFADALKEMAERAQQQRRPPPPSSQTATNALFELCAKGEGHETVVAGCMEVRPEDFYGSRVEAAVIQEIEAESIRRLPAELKRGVPRQVQRLFFYGGYEHLPRDAKRHLRHVVTQLKASGNLDDEALNREFLRAFQHASGATPPEMLVNQTPAAGVGAIAWLLREATQKLTDYTYTHMRQAKWLDARRKIAAEIPAGKQESVLFIEDLKIFRSDLFHWMECLSVSAYRGPMDVKATSVLDPFEKLENLRKPSGAEPWKLTRLRRLPVRGTGEGAAPPTTKDAYVAGLEMGELAAGGKLDRGLMRATYSKYNQNEDTREAFKRGYRRGSQGQ